MIFLDVKLSRIKKRSELRWWHVRNVHLVISYVLDSLWLNFGWEVEEIFLIRNIQFSWLRANPWSLITLKANFLNFYHN